MKIHIRKGAFNSIKITDCVFPLQSIEHTLGQAYALVDASSVLGKGHENIRVLLSDYRVLG